jgi:hypothetical protein
MKRHMLVPFIALFACALSLSAAEEEFAGVVISDIKTDLAEMTLNYTIGVGPG